MVRRSLTRPLAPVKSSIFSAANRPLADARRCPMVKPQTTPIANMPIRTRVSIRLTSFALARILFCGVRSLRIARNKKTDSYVSGLPSSVKKGQRATDSNYVAVR